MHEVWVRTSNDPCVGQYSTSPGGHGLGDEALVDAFHWSFRLLAQLLVRRGGLVGFPHLVGGIFSTGCFQK